jgi:hypothetical protein
MFEYVFDAMRRATEFNIQTQQEVFKKWFSLGPGLGAAPEGVAEEFGKVKKEWAEFAAEVVKKQRGALESQFTAGLQVVEEACHLAEAKDPEELRTRTVELCHKAFDNQRQLYEAQIRDFHAVVARWTDLVLKGAVPPPVKAAPREATVAA